MPYYETVLKMVGDTIIHCHHCKANFTLAEAEEGGQHGWTGDYVMCNKCGKKIDMALVTYDVSTHEVKIVPKGTKIEETKKIEPIKTENSVYLRMLNLSKLSISKIKSTNVKCLESCISICIESNNGYIFKIDTMPHKTELVVRSKYKKEFEKHYTNSNFGIMNVIETYI